jgi:murein DD-endopeptidase MepM/ murein hydrolase activator NlpD
LSVSSSLKSYSNANTDWELKDISSDFGKRRVSSGNRWHNGVDITDKNIGVGQLGDAIISPEDGIVSYMGRYDGSNYRVIAVDGQNHDFGYGHIFVSGMLNSLPYRIGNFVYTQAEPIPNEVQAPYVIINLNTCEALAEQHGRMVVIPNLISCSDTLFTTDTVTAGMEIAPIGKSGTSPVHIHLYRLRNATNPPSLLGSGTSWNSGFDPFTVLTNPINNYDVNVAHNQDIDANSFSNWGGGVLNYGTSDNSIDVSPFIRPDP